MLSSLPEAAQDKSRTNSAQAACFICKSHVNLSIFMDLLDSCSAKMLEQDENETARGDERSFLDMFPHITKERSKIWRKRTLLLKK